MVCVIGCVDWLRRWLVWMVVYVVCVGSVSGLC